MYLVELKHHIIVANRENILRMISQYLSHILKLDLASGTGEPLLQCQRYVFVNTGNQVKWDAYVGGIIVNFL